MAKKIPCDYHKAQDEFDENCIHCVGRKEFKKMKTFTVEFFDTFEAENEEEAYKSFLAYLESCVKWQDLSGFNIIENEDE